MNKLSLSPVRRNINMDLFNGEENEDYYEHMYEESLEFSQKYITSSSINSNKNINPECNNSNCENISNEINKLKEECLNLENKCILIDYVKSEQLFEISEKISTLNKVVNNIIDSIENYEGEGLEELTYDKLTEIEMSLLKLLTKVKMRMAKLENDILKGVGGIAQSFTCIICKKLDINCVIKPCKHVCICLECVTNTLKCPICFKYIEYYDKVFLPNN